MEEIPRHISHYKISFHSEHRFVNLACRIYIQYATSIWCVRLNANNVFLHHVRFVFSLHISLCRTVCPDRCHVVEPIPCESQRLNDYGLKPELPFIEDFSCALSYSGEEQCSCRNGFLLDDADFFGLGPLSSYLGFSWGTYMCVKLASCPTSTPGTTLTPPCTVILFLFLIFVDY